jgi:DNA repair protein RecO
MKQVVTQGIVLSRTNFGEADRILTILTPDQGRIRAIAKGARKIKSKLAGGIELFSISQITFIQGKSDIYTLISTRLAKHFGKISSDIERTIYGYEILKLINKSVEDNAEMAYFTILSNSLEALNQLEIPKEVIDLWVQAQMLKLAGHSPNLTADSTHQKLSAERNYKFSIDTMTFVPYQHGMYRPNHIKLIRLAFSLPSPLQLGKVKDIDTVLQPSLSLIKSMTHQYAHS